MCVGKREREERVSVRFMFECVVPCTHTLSLYKTNDQVRTTSVRAGFVDIMVKEALVAVAGGLVTAPFVVVVVVVVVVSLDGTQPIMLMLLLLLYDSMNIKI